MESVTIKIKRTLKEGFTDCRDFGPRMAAAKIGWIWGNDSVASAQRKDRAILRYLERQYAPLLDKYKHAAEPADVPPDGPVWVLWWSGEETMPPIIRLCLESKRRCAGCRQVVVLDQTNIRDYISFPEEIWQQYHSGKLRIQHLADMIRVQLIRRHGGLWLDASIFCGRPIPDDCFQRPLYSIKGTPDPYFVSDNRWTTFAIGGAPGNVLCSFLDDFFQAYCLSGKRFIDYFMFDCAIALAYRHIPAVQASVDALPPADGDCYWLHHHLNIDMPVPDALPTFSKIGWSAFGLPTPGTLYESLWKETML